MLTFSPPKDVLMKNDQPVFDRECYGLRALRRATLNGYAMTLLPDEAADVVAEVERLRAGVERLREDVATFSDDFRRVTSETCAPDELHCSCVPHLRAEVEAARTEAATMRTWAEDAAAAENENAEDARKERAAVVAWLRAGVDAAMKMHLPYGGLSGAADDIESGEHRREETE